MWMAFSWCRRTAAPIASWRKSSGRGFPPSVAASHSASKRKSDTSRQTTPAGRGKWSLICSRKAGSVSPPLPARWTCPVASGVSKDIEPNSAIRSTPHWSKPATTLKPAVPGRWRALLERAPDLDAVFAANDLMAAGAVEALRARARRVPEDVAVGGFDDSPVAASCEPPLTTIRQPFGRISAEMVRLLAASHRRPIARRHHPADRIDRPRLGVTSKSERACIL